MKNKSNKSGFTLVELLVAMTIIVTIVSIVYGSYFATSKSAQACKARIAGSQQGRKVLRQMARQIRCSYTGTFQRDLLSVSKVSKQKSAVSYFNSNADDPSGEILHFVTTSGPTDGLFEITYKFNKSKGLLSLSRQRFIGVSEDAIEKGNWQQVASNVERFELTFLDGQKWLKGWNFDKQKKLPNAVKIDITCTDENYQQCHYETVAYVCCRKN